MKSTAQRLTLVTAVLIGLALVGIIAWQRFTPTASAVEDASAPEFNLAEQPMIGDPNAPVTIVAFEDFKCPVCKAFEDQSYPQIIRNHVETGQAKMYFYNYQFIGPDSVTAGIAGECAFRQDEAAFWDYKTYIYRAQGEESETWATPEVLVNLARENVPELDPAALSACIQERRHEDAVTADREAGQAAMVDATPTIFVNDNKLESWDYASVQTAIEAALP